MTVLNKVALLFISTAVVFGLLLFIYFGPKPEQIPSYIDFLPMLNALLNSLSFIFVLLGLNLIKKKEIKKHKQCMITALGTSALFLVSYLTYHFYHGDTKFLGLGVIKFIYFFILITHILASALQVPLLLFTTFYALTENFVQHKKIARFAWPVWLYVSFTGVVIFLFLKTLNTSA